VCRNLVARTRFNIERLWQEMYVGWFYPPGPREMHRGWRHGPGAVDIKGQSPETGRSTRFWGLGSQLMWSAKPPAMVRPAGDPRRKAAGVVGVAAGPAGRRPVRLTSRRSAEALMAAGIGATDGTPPWRRIAGQRLQSARAGAPWWAGGLAKRRQRVSAQRATSTSFHQKFDYIRPPCRCCKLIEEYEPYS